ncbi:MAG: hypothetical protein IJJ86_02745 [Clostridia bacterium]|nr:hypothetical protein [Clostridia bacterium]
MRNLHRIWIVLLACILLAGLFACGRSGSASGTEADATDFSFADAGNGLPEGWSVVSYEDRYETTLADGVFGLVPDGEDDIRLCRMQGVKPETVYRLSAEIRTENVRGGKGATLSIDNYAADGSFIYSEPLTGTNDWTQVTLTFRTAESQTAVLLALRLGGYSEESEGRVWFRNVRFATAEGASDYQQLVPSERESEPVELSELTDDERREYEAKIEAITDYYEGIFMAIFLAGAIAAIVLLAFVCPKMKELALQTDPLPYKYWIFWIIVLVGVLVRIVLFARYKGHDTDMTCWSSWGRSVAQNGPASVYGGFCDYPPGYMYILAVLYRISTLFGGDGGLLFTYLLPAIVCDVLSGWLLLRAAKRFGLGDRPALLLAGAIVLNPAATFLSGAWGQVDSVCTVLLIGVFLLLNASREKPYYRLLAGLLYGAAILMKWQALIAGPVLALMYVMTGVDQLGTKRFREHVYWSFAAVIGAVLVLILGTLPACGGESPLAFLYRIFTHAVGYYKGPAIDAYNFHALFGGNWYNPPYSESLELLPLLGSDHIGAMLLRANEIFSRLALLILFPTLIARAWERMRSCRDGEKNAARIELAAAVVLFGLLAVLRYLAAKFTSDNEAVRVLMEAIKAFPLYGLIAVGWIAVLAYRECRGKWIAEWLKTGGATVTGTLTMFLAFCVFALTFLLSALFRLFGGTLSYRIFGYVNIGLACVVTGGLFAVCWIRHKKTRYSLYVNRGLVFLLASCFYVWVFTFALRQHERYVFPAIFLLAFAYAYDRDPRKLKAFCMISVVTFLNVMVAQFVYSHGSADLLENMVQRSARYYSIIADQMHDFIRNNIQAKDLHNAMIAQISLMEVASALYLIASAFRGALTLDPGDPTGLHPVEPGEPQKKRGGRR